MLNALPDEDFEETTHNGLLFSSPMSLLLAQRVYAYPKACWWNAARSVTQVLLKTMRGARYVEGIAANTDVGYTFEHGWVTVMVGADEVVCDPTLILAGHFDPAEYAYHAAFSWSREELQNLRPRINARRSMPLVAWHHRLTTVQSEALGRAQAAAYASVDWDDDALRKFTPTLWHLVHRPSDKE